MLVTVSDIKFKHSRNKSGLYSKLKEVISSLKPGQAFIFTPDKYPPQSFRHLKPAAYQTAKRLGKKVCVRQHELGMAVMLADGST